MLTSLKTGISNPRERKHMCKIDEVKENSFHILNFFWEYPYGTKMNVHTQKTLRMS